MLQREAVHFVKVKAAILNACKTPKAQGQEFCMETEGCREVIFKLGVEGGWRGAQIGESS